MSSSSLWSAKCRCITGKRGLWSDRVEAVAVALVKVAESSSLRMLKCGVSSSESDVSGSKELTRDSCFLKSLIFSTVVAMLAEISAFESDSRMQWSKVARFEGEEGDCCCSLED